MKEEELNKAYKQAVIEISKIVPQLIEAMNRLSREIHLMPRAIRVHP